MPHQTMALQGEAADSPLEFVWRVDDRTRLPLNLFAPAGSAARAVRCDAPFNETTQYDWIVSGIESSAAGLGPGRLVLLAQRVVATPGHGLGFGVLGTTLIAVDNADDPPTAWRFRSANLTRCASASVCVFVHMGPSIARNECRDEACIVASNWQAWQRHCVFAINCNHRCCPPIATSISTIVFVALSSS